MSRKFIILLSILIAAVILSACGKGNNPAESQGGPHVYVPEYLPLEQGDTHFLDITLTDSQAGYLYYERDEHDSMDTKIRFCSLIDKSATDRSLSLRSGESLLKYTLDESGGIYAVFISWNADDSEANGGHQEYILTAFDPAEKELFHQNITAQVEKDSLASVSGISIDSQGRLYVFGNSLIWLYSADGEYQGTVDLSELGYSWFQSAGIDRMGRMYIAGSGWNGYELTGIDFEKKSTGSTYRNFYTGSGICVFGKGIDKDFLISDGTSVYEYDLEDQSLLELFK